MRVDKSQIELMAKTKSKRRILMNGKRKRRCRSTKQGQWADLPPDISRIIKDKLCLPDQVRFSAVCKGWRVFAFGKPLPIAMTYCTARHGPDMKFACELYGQCGRRIHNAIYDMSYQNCAIYDMSYYNWLYSDTHYSATRRPEVCASKNGWLLAVDFVHLSGPVRLINPFSNTVLPCPQLGHRIHAATFSGNPTSQNCVIFAFYSSCLGKTHLGTYYTGDQSWNKFIIAERTEAPEPMHAVCTTEGMLYYVFRDGMLGCYNFAEQYVTILCDSFPKDYSLRNEKQFFRLVECEGQILLALASGQSNYMWHLFRFDKSQMAWIASKSLEGWTLFASPTPFIVRASGDEADLADCVCYFDLEINKAMVYSFKDQKLRKHDYKPQRDFGWRKVEEPLNDSTWWTVDGYLPHYNRTIWIETPNI